MTRILVVDDVRPLAEQYAYDLQRLGDWETLVAGGGEEALAVLERDSVDAVVLDLEMPGTDGMAVLRRLMQQGNETPVIVYTAAGNFERCVEAVRLGAYGFVDKNEPMERIVHELRTALERHRLRREVAALRRRVGDSSLLGTSAGIRAVRSAIERLAAIPSPVLILGESGTGKELVARDLHHLGPAAGEPFVPINAAALPDALVESELFGHERGAFTGAVAARAGAFEAAGAGTLFLDEVGELPPATQPKLLRALESREISRLGGTRTTEVRCRVVAATHRDLAAAVDAGGFREDLLYRLNVHIIEVPPLRDHADDVPVLAERFLAETCERFGVLPRRFAPEAMQALVQWEWRRNNVRELRNVVERMVVAADGEVLRHEHLPAELRGSGEAASTWTELKADAERQLVLQALARNGGHVTRTAESLGLADHASLLKIMRRLGIERGEE